MTLELIYFANPMCSWCWGFTPVIAGLLDRYATRLRLTLAMGALGRGGEPMREIDRSIMRGHWDHVRDASGQPFDLAFFDRPSFVYDTEPSCIAMAVVRAQDDTLAITFLAAVQHAFYAQNRDVTAHGELTRIAQAMGIEAASFEMAMAAPASRNALAQEFAQAAALGVTGYPTLLALGPGGPQALALGWRPLAEVEAALLPLLEQATQH